MTRGVMMTAMRSWVLALALLASCGPVAYVNQVTREATSKVQRAKQLEADKYSPYWWTRAQQYLRMAREVAAHADFQGATRFGRLAAQAADNAANEASQYKGVGETPGLAPAKEEP